jgi:hypothetical protein
MTSRSLPPITPPLLLVVPLAHAALRGRFGAPIFRALRTRRAAGIGLLLLGRCPSDVTRLVVAVVVDPVKRVQRLSARVFTLRARPDGCLDVSNERGQVMPAFTDPDTPAAVSLIGHIPGVMTAADHAVPGVVQRVPRETVNGRPVMPTDLQPARLPLQAAARPLLPAGQIGQLRQNLCSAVAPADGGPPAGRLRGRDADLHVDLSYGQPLKSLAYLNEYPRNRSSHGTNSIRTAQAN